MTPGYDKGNNYCLVALSGENVVMVVGDTLLDGDFEGLFYFLDLFSLA